MRHDLIVVVWNVQADTPYAHHLVQLVQGQWVDALLALGTTTHIPLTVRAIVRAEALRERDMLLARSADPSSTPSMKAFSDLMVHTAVRY